jgi:hypothetical protein
LLGIEYSLDVLVLILSTFDGQLGVEAFEASDNAVDLLLRMIQLKLACFHHSLNF